MRLSCTAKHSGEVSSLKSHAKDLQEKIKKGIEDVSNFFKQEVDKISGDIEAVQDYFEAAGTTDYTPAAVREAVIAIRTRKLPDPAVVHNCGSFFGNPIVSDWEFAKIKQAYDVVPHWPTDDQMVKLSAAWLIEQAGFTKGYTLGAAGISSRHTLALINRGGASAADILALAEKIAGAVEARFGILLEREPVLVGR